MRLSISNIAWDVAEDETVAALLREFGVDAIDIAPGKYFSEPTVATDADIARVRRQWAVRGFEITGMQALLFGTQGLNLFGDDASRVWMLTHLGALCRIGRGLGATRLVFGSPRNRDRGALADEVVESIALPFFRALGDIACRHGVVVCLEPNPPRYGGNYMTDSAGTEAVVRAVDHPGIRLQLDLGALAINGEDPAVVVPRCAPLVGHIHLSEPDLVPLGDGTTDHVASARAVRARFPGAIACIETVATRDEPHLSSIRRSLVTARSHYAPLTESR